MSIIKIDRGLDAVPYGRLRLDDLMAVDRYVMPTPSDNSDQAAQDRTAVRQANWYGSLPDVEHRLKMLKQQRDEAQARLDSALREMV